MILTRTRKIVSGLALAAIVSLTAVSGLAQDGGQGQGDERGGQHRGHKGGGRGMRGGGFFRGLDLTDAQKEQMRQIAERHRQSTQALRQRERGNRDDGPAAFNGTFNESAVRAAAQARANARVEMEVAHARMMSEMYNVLTAEQKAQLASQREQRQERRQRRQTNDQL